MTNMKQDSIETLLAHLYRQGVRLSATDNRIKCSGPPEIVAAVQSTLANRKSEIIEFLSAGNGKVGDYTIGRQQRPARIPLSFSQQRLWFLQEMQPETAVYNIPFAIEINGLLDLSAFRKSFAEIVSRHEILRTNFVTEAGEPAQIITDSRQLEIIEIDLREQPDAENQVRLAAREDAARPFDVTRDSLLRVAVYRVDIERFIVLFTVHHIISDAWSTDVLLREFASHYCASLLGKSAELAPLSIQYADYAVWQREWLQGEVLEEQLGFWREQLSGELPTLNLPTDFPRKRVQTFAGAVENFSVPQEVADALQAIAQTNSASLFMTLLAAFNLLLRRYTGQHDLLVGTPIANRHRPEVEGLIGLLVNTLIIRTRLNPDDTFLDTLAKVRQTTLEAYQHQDLPFEKLVETVQPDRDMSLSPLFQAKFRLENAPQNDIELPGLSLRRLPQELTTAKLDLSVDMYETPEGLVGGFEYNSDLFSPATIRRMATHFVTLLESIAKAPEQRVAELAVLPPAEQRVQLEEWNTHDLPYADSACFHHLFEAQVERTPEAIALIFDGGDASSRLEVTYHELNCRANRLAHHLRQQGIGPEKIVAICLDRSIEMVVAMLAVMKAGGAYVPLDPGYPKDRLQFLMEDADAQVLLTTSHFELPDVQDTHAPLRIDLDTAELGDAAVDNPQAEVVAENLAYLIYTSGTTGKPKGVLVPHSGLVNLTEDKIRVCDVHEGDCVLQFFSYSFDGSVPEFTMTLAPGATLLLAPATTVLPGPDLQALLLRNKVSHLTMTPSALAALPSDDYPSLRMVLVGGEAPSPELIESWSQGRVFINAYGPTEATVNASMVRCGNGQPIEPTIKPSANKQLYVLDEQLELTPIGVIGELHIGGVGLTRGYHRQAGLTAQRFIPNPFPPAPERNYNVPLLYKTGDLACYLPDGRIRIVGRTDQQTKIRGFRIELSEIERVLEGHPYIQIGLVRIRETPSGGKQLVAYGVPCETQQETTPPESTAKIRDYLAEKLPKFMLPSVFIWLDELPLTENGKLDEAALPSPEEVATQAKTQPRTETEKKLSPIFAEALSVSDLGTGDNFFDLGGHSLLATRLVSQVMETFDVEITVIDLFDAPTVAKLAQRIEHKQHLQHLVNADAGEGEREEIAL